MRFDSKLISIIVIGVAAIFFGVRFLVQFATLSFGQIVLFGLQEFIFISAVIALIFQNFKGKGVKAERENTIQLRVTTISHLVITWIFVILVCIYAFFPKIDPFYILVVLAVPYLYWPIIGTLYYRKKLA